MWGRRCGRATWSPNSTRNRSRTACAPRRPRLAAAQASLHEATNNLERQQTLVGQGWTTRVQYDAAEKAFQTAKAAVDAASAVLHTAEDQLGYTQLVADAAGVRDRHRRRGRRGGPGRPDDRDRRAHNGVDAVFDVPDSLMRQAVPRRDVITVALTDDPSIRADRAGAGGRTAGGSGDPKLPGQGRTGSAARSHAAGRDGVRAGAHAGRGRHRASGHRADHGGQQAGRLGGRSQDPGSVAAARSDCSGGSSSIVVVRRS